MQDKSPAPKGEPSAGRQFFGWLVVGIAGVGLLFVASVHFPDTIKVPGLFAVGLAAVAGFGLGHWGTAMNIRPTAAVAIAAWLAIAGGEVIATIKTNSDRVAYLRTQREWQDLTGHPIEEALKRSLDEQPAAQSEEQKRRQQEIRDQIEFGESYRRERLERLTFYGFLKERIPKAWGKWTYPWPAVFWGAEIIVGSTLGAWLMLFTLRNAAPPDPAAATQVVNSGDDGRGDRG
jgi:hypothetical protein